MHKSNKKFHRFFRSIRVISRWIKKNIVRIIFAFMIGFSNAYLNENRMINDIKNVIECEQIMDDEDIN